MLLGRPITECELKCVLRCISYTSAFLFTRSASFSPDVRWLHTKQKSVWYTDMLTDIDPWRKKVLIEFRIYMWLIKWRTLDIDQLIRLFLTLICIHKHSCIYFTWGWNMITRKQRKMKMWMKKVGLVHFNYQAKSDPTWCCYAIWQDITIKVITEIVCYNLCMILALSTERFTWTCETPKGFKLAFY